MIIESISYLLLGSPLRLYQRKRSLARRQFNLLGDDGRRGSGGDKIVKMTKPIGWNDLSLSAVGYTDTIYMRK